MVVLVVMIGIEGMLAAGWCDRMCSVCVCRMASPSSVFIVMPFIGIILTVRIAVIIVVISVEAFEAATARAASIITGALVYVRGVPVHMHVGVHRNETSQAAQAGDGRSGRSEIVVCITDIIIFIIIIIDVIAYARANTPMMEIAMPLLVRVLRMAEARYG